MAKKFVKYEQRRAAERQNAALNLPRNADGEFCSPVPHQGVELAKGEALDLAAKKVGLNGEILRRAMRVENGGHPSLNFPILYLLFGYP